MATQSALTFSRGGLYNAVGAGIVALLFMMRDAGSRLKVLGVAAVVVLVANFVILPRLDSFTEGALMTRFQNTKATGRMEIIISDLQIWKNNIVLGVGLGQSKHLRGDLFRSAIAHTEFSRLLSEQGVFGLLIIILLLKMALQNVIRARTHQSRAIMAALVVWTFLYMLNAAMRTVAPAFIFGLTFITVLSGNKALVTQLRARYLIKLASVLKTRKLARAASL
jgi:hypothetical protein